MEAREHPITQPVCVTGATGFIGGHIVEELLKAKYHVRATVRSKQNVEKLHHLALLIEKYCSHSQYESSEGPSLTLYEADLLDEGSFDEAIEGCWGVIHSASPVAPKRPEDPFKELVLPAREGTRNVLQSCKKAGVKKVVITSSDAVINNGNGDPGSTPPIYNEEDNNTHCSLDWHAYSYSKVEAEKATNTFLKGLPEEERFQVVTIHPSFVFGPQQAKFVTSSNQVVKLLMRGEYPICPPLHFQTVDVRDVARAHRYVLENEDAQGRYIVSNSPRGGVWMKDIAKILKQHFPYHPIPTYAMPFFLFRLLSFIDARITPEYLKDRTVVTSGLDGSKIERELCFTYRFKDALDVTLKDTAQSMIDLGIVPVARRGPKKRSLFGMAVLLLCLAGVIGYLWRRRSQKRIAAI